MNLDSLIVMSHKYGADEDYVLAGGGNTSFKDSGVMYIKSSGTSLSDITHEQFTSMDVEQLKELTQRVFPDGISEKSREDLILRYMMAARLPESCDKRPSVEVILHAIFPYTFVLHLHPAQVNGLTCAAGGEKIAKELFGDSVVWISCVRPGISLAKACKEAFDEYNLKYGKYPQLVLLQNHGIVAAADTIDEIDSIMDDVRSKIDSRVTEKPDLSAVSFDRERACRIAPALRILYDESGDAVAVLCVNKQIAKIVADEDAFSDLERPFTPDHIVYYKDEPLFINNDTDIIADFKAFEKRKGYKPKIVAIKGLGCFALGNSAKEAVQARMLFLDAVKVAVYARQFGGIMPITDEFADFILNWEVEHYRSRVSFADAGSGRLNRRIVLITGGAQGIGKGIARFAASEGAYVIIADLNREGAAQCAAELCESFNDPYRASAIPADVTDEKSVRYMIEETVLMYGGLDILISNAGVLIAGGLNDMTAQKFDFVTNVNFKGYFLCTKYASEIMKIQSRYSPGYLMDIIEINSKSGLEGSNKNFAYAGSKFGGIGLTQSFAMELVEYGIKVNAICPGNFLDGPLWADPETGLFRQYLDTGKVSGAKTIADVRKFYEEKVPLKRGCTIDDVTRAVLYVIEQKYETGQAIPVTGGQIMLS